MTGGPTIVTLLQPAKLVFGPGCAAQLTDYLSEMAWTRPFVVLL